MKTSEAMNKPEKKNGFEKYEIEGACDTLLRAEEIKQNPKLMAEVLKQMGKKKKAYDSIASLKAKRDEMFTQKPDQDEDEE